MSEKLLPCPFCQLPVRTEKSEHPRLHRPSRNGWHVVCDGCELLFGYDVDYAGIYETGEEAIAAWNRRAKCTEIEAIKNEPLTLDELQGMDGEPVWIEWLLKDDSDFENGRWFMVTKAGSSDFGFAVKRPLDFGCNVCNNTRYGKTWIAYRHKPEREDV